MKNTLGVMQGRFVSKGGFFPQKFPWNGWADEFYTAQKYDVDCIEWMFNAERFWENPIWTNSGIMKMKNIISDSGVGINAICANYFMEYDIEHDKSGFSVLQHLIELAEKLSINQIIIPLFGASQMLDINRICSVFGKICDMLCTSCVCIGFETELPASVQREICGQVNSDKCGICYDVGNAAGNGYDCIEEVSSIIDYLLEVHLKDKPFMGKSVMLGEGAVDFSGVFQNINSKMIYVLESFFDSNAEEDTIKNIQYVRSKLYG